MKKILAVGILALFISPILVSASLPLDQINKVQSSTSKGVLKSPVKKVLRKAVKKDTPVAVKTNDVVLTKQNINDDIEGSKKVIGNFTQWMDDANNFDVKINSEMAKYPDPIVQQIGNQIIENDRKLNVVMANTITLMNNFLVKVTPYANSDAVLKESDIVDYESQLKINVDAYHASKDLNIPLIKPFVNAEVAYLNNETNRIQNQINSEISQQNAARQQQQIDSNNAYLNQYNSIVGQGNGVPSSIINGQLHAAGLIPQTNCYFSSVGGMTPGAGSMTCY